MCTRKQEEDLSKPPTCRAAFVNADCGVSPKQRQIKHICLVFSPSCGHNEDVSPDIACVSECLLLGQR